MLNQIQVGPIQQLMIEERGRLGTVPASYGVPLVLSRQGGWTALEKGLWDLPTVRVVVFGKAI